MQNARPFGALSRPPRDNKLYVFLSRKPFPKRTGTDFRTSERHFLATGIGSVATGILGVFPTCTSRQRYLYIQKTRNVLILNRTTKRADTCPRLPSLQIQRYKIIKRFASGFLRSVKMQSAFSAVKSRCFERENPFAERVRSVKNFLPPPFPSHERSGRAIRAQPLLFIVARRAETAVFVRPKVRAEAGLISVSPQRKS